MAMSCSNGSKVKTKARTSLAAQLMESDVSTEHSMGGLSNLP